MTALSELLVDFAQGDLFMAIEDNPKSKGRTSRRMLLTAVGTGALLTACTNDIVGANEPDGAAGTAVHEGGKDTGARMGLFAADAGTREDAHAVGLGPVDAGTREDAHAVGLGPVDAGTREDAHAVGLGPVDAGGGGFSPLDAGSSEDGHAVGLFPVEGGSGH
jgi:hypothetical protein